MTSLTTLADYEVFVYSLRDRFPTIRYDSQPHPDDFVLARTYPHHRHVPPNIKRNRIPAPGLSFTRPNLTFLIEEIEREILSKPASG